MLLMQLCFDFQRVRVYELDIKIRRVRKEHLSTGTKPSRESAKPLQEEVFTTKSIRFGLGLYLILLPHFWD